METDDFDDVYGDDLDALLEIEQEVGDEFEPFNTKSRKSLNFSTPSTVHVRSKRKKDEEDGDSSLLNDSFPTPLPTDTPVAAGKDGRTVGVKRRQEDMFGSQSDEENDSGNTRITKDLSDSLHKSKRPRMNGRTPDVEDEFTITPPTSPTPLERAMGAFKRTKTDDSRGATFSEYQDRITQGYDLDRPRVLRLRPKDKDFVNVTDSEGRRVYMAVKDELALSHEIDKLATGKQQLELLGSSLQELRVKVAQERTKRLLEQTKQLAKTIQNSEADDYEKEEEVRPKEEVEETGKPALWVERYSPQYYTELLSDEATNRLLLRWLKQWDYVVFGKEHKPPKGGDQKKDQPKGKKGKESQGKPQFNKNAPEVTDELDQHKRPMQKVALLCGPPGLGKTTLAHVIARHAGYNVVEMNASDDRSQEIFKTKIEAATQMKSVIGQDPRPNCLVIDEIDGAPQPAINMLLSTIKGPDGAAPTKKKKKKVNLLLRPIICICNDVYTPALRQLRQMALTITFPPTVPNKLAGRLQEISRQQGLKADLTTLLALCEKSDNDIRSCLNTLQFVRSKSKELTLAAVNSASVGQKDLQKSMFAVWQHIFTMPKPKRKRYINPHDRGNLPLKELEEMSMVNQNNLSQAARFQNTLQLAQAAGESEKVMQGLHENYLVSKVKDPRMELVQLANSWLVFVDVLNQNVAKTQNFILGRYTPYLPIAFHLLFASNHHPRIMYPHSQYENLTKQNKSHGLMEAMLTDMIPSVRKNLTVPVIVMETLPPLLDIIQPNLRPVNTQLYSKREKAELAQLIRIMIAYNMTYHQERGMDGQYTYNLDPCVDQVARLPTIKQHKQLTYAAKQLIAREIELEKMRRSESGQSMNTGPVAPPAEPEKKQTTKTAAAAAADAATKKSGKGAELPNHLRQSLQPKAIAPGADDQHAVDFFGRKLQGQESGPNSKDASREVIGGDIWFRFKEGFTNAVRRTVRIADLL